MYSDTSYLEDLGYSETQIGEFNSSWAEGILAYLSAYGENVRENMRLLQPHLDAELLLQLPAYYPDAFTLAPRDFKKHISALQSACPGTWAQIIEDQFRDWDGDCPAEEPAGERALSHPFLETVGTNADADIARAVRSLQEPETRGYQFLCMLREAAGIELTAADFFVYSLPFLERGRYELLDNVRFLRQKNVSEAAVRSLLLCAPLVMTEPQTALEEALSNAFGDNYPENINALPAEALEALLAEL